LVDFDVVGINKVKLIVTDSYNLTSEIEKEITVESTLRPQLVAAPTASIW
jgi:PKD repeat protein